MKKATHIVLLFLLAGTITSCEKIKSWFDVEGDGTLKGTLYIDVQDQSMKSTAGNHFYEETTINPLDDDDIAEYEDNITEIKATGVVAKVTEIMAPDEKNVIFEKGVRITVDGSESVFWELDQEWHVQLNDEIRLEDQVSLDIYGKITDMLSNFETLAITVEGYCNQTNVFVTLEVGVSVHYTANPL